MPFKVGVTGGIGSGKSIVCSVLQTMGYPVYNSDDRAKELMHTNVDIKHQLVAVFGEQTFQNDQLNRPFLAQLIFNDSSLRERINAIVHPIVRADFHEWVAQQSSDIVFQESALLFETGAYRLLDFTVLVTAPEEVRVQRVVKRDTSAAADVLLRIKSQQSDELKQSVADFVLVNDDEQLLIPQLNQLLEQLRRKL